MINAVVEGSGEEMNSVLVPFSMSRQFRIDKDVKLRLFFEHK